VLADQGDALGGGGVPTMLNADNLSIPYPHYLRQLLLGLSMLFPLFQDPLAKKLL
jgi:hypothetical protein